MTLTRRRTTSSASTTHIPGQFRERAVRQVRATGCPIAHVAKDLGIHKEALRGWVRQVEVDSGERDDRLTAAGVAPRVVMEILGHSQIAVTMNVYTHVVQDTQREAVSHMDRLLRRRPGRR
nr:transposase [Streptomyces sp. MRC013]